MNPQVEGLSCSNTVSLGTAEYLGVPSARYAHVMQVTSDRVPGYLDPSGLGARGALE